MGTVAKEKHCKEPSFLNDKYNQYIQFFFKYDLNKSFISHCRWDLIAVKVDLITDKSVACFFVVDMPQTNFLSLVHIDPSKWMLTCTSTEAAT